MANAQRRANRDRMFKSLLDAGYDPGTAGNIANTPDWGKANNRFNAAMANAPGKPAPAPAPPPPPKPTPKPAEQTQTTISSIGDTVRRPQKKRKKTTLASLRIKPTTINKQLGGTGYGSGLNIGG